MHLCNVCNQESLSIIELHNCSIYRCNACNHAFSENINISSDSVYHKGYYTEKHRNFFENPDIDLYKRISDNLLRFKPKTAAILDMGCGTGSLLKLLLQEGFTNLTGVDLMKNEHNSITFIQGDIFDFQTDKKYDAIMTVMTIEHIKDINNFMRKLYGLLKQDGLLLINTINEDFILYPIARILYRININFAVERLYEIHHINHFNRKSLKILGESNGFSQIGEFTKNYPLRCIDIPYKKISFLFRVGLAITFFLSTLAGKEFTQTQIFKKNAS